jgi:cytochrome c oxidase subunit 2
VRTHGRAALASIGVLLLLLTGCGGPSPSTLAPHGPKSGWTTWAWWLLFAVAAFVCVVVIAMVVLAAVFRRKATKIDHGDGKKFVLVFGVAIPAVVFAGVFALSVSGIASNGQPPQPAKTTIQVIGHQWWWEARYPNGAVTADVIHSFWIPELTPKMDLLPKRVNRTWVTADKVGSYEGECAEYCGLQHAHMHFTVVADPPAKYQQWLANEKATAAEPTDALTAQGKKVFTSFTCATCHTIRGTSAGGKVGPDLTHVGSRKELAAGAIPNDVGHMSGWVANSQTVKPGNKMPPQPLSPRDLRAVVAYLQSLE